MKLAIFKAHAAQTPKQERPAEPAAPRRVPLVCRTSAKAAAFITVIISAALSALSILAALLMLNYQLYTTPEAAFRRAAFTNLARIDAQTVSELVLSGREDEAADFCQNKNILSAGLRAAGQNGRVWQFQSASLSAPASEYTIELLWDGDTGSPSVAAAGIDLEGADIPLSVAFTLDDSLPVQDGYHMAGLLISLAYSMRYMVFVIGAAAALLALAAFIFLLCASGRRPGFEGPRPGWGTAVPIDLLTGGAAFAACLLVALAMEVSYSVHSPLNAVFYIAAGAALITIALGWCMSFALRVKLGGWWKNSVIWRALLLPKAVIKRLPRVLGPVRQFAVSLIRGLPLVWKTAAIFAAVSLIELFALLLNWWEPGNIALLWALEKLLLLPLVLSAALMLRRLLRGGEALASGDLSYQVDTRHMLFDLKKHGEALNRIGEGMTCAVEQRLKSERMKTELITNVSHDIKTPLTSIINYAGLIGRERCGNERIEEYAEVLLRQSDRLRRLIDDLVEASKASTGNLEVLLSPCEAGVMLAQAAGEYQRRMKELGLELVARQPEQPVKILADGRRLWRVFDNLLGNICKYSQSGTRVYLTLEQIGGSAVISFKNTSRDELNIPADELMERFVRGDEARNSDGNGLGLSIARSLTELQNGSMELSVDGDLFKVTLRFPVIK